MSLRKSKVQFLTGGETNRARLTTGGIVGGQATSPLADFYGELAFLIRTPKNRHERRSREKRFSAMLTRIEAER